MISVVHSLKGNVYRADHGYADLVRVRLSVGAGGVVTDSVVLVAEPSFPAHGLLAIVIDDVGYRSLRESERFADLPFPLTLAILPGRGNSAELARRARASGKTVLLHLPMEPMDPGEPLEPNTITLTMDDKQIRSVTRKQLDSVPGIVGVNNHMGSRATQDERVMSAVLEEIRRRGLFFLDSYTTPNSVAARVSRGMGIPTLERQVFIDNTADVEAIQRELLLAASRAARSGRIVAIGHDRPETLEALRLALPKLQEMGVRLCTVSEMLR